MIKSVLFSMIFIVLGCHSWSQDNKTRNLIIVTLDGLRWQEIFEGADLQILSRGKFIADKSVVEKFGDPVATVRRKKLMPFFWNTIGVTGQIYGNRRFNNLVDCSNSHWLSYPGYSEMLVGFVDRQVKSNNPLKNPNETVLDFIQSQPGFKEKVATFATWDLISQIAFRNRNTFHVNTGMQSADGDVSREENLLNDLQELLPTRHGARFDAITFFYAFEYLKRKSPRVMLISFDETDVHAHHGKYDDYLMAANKTDAMIGRLWNYLQSHPVYKDKTTLLITTDHGRGDAGNSWKHHGRLTFGSSQIWFAVIGPDTPAWGEVKIQSQYYQKQFAKTTAAFLGFDYGNVAPVGAVIESMIAPKQQNNADLTVE